MNDPFTVKILNIKYPGIINRDDKQLNHPRVIAQSGNSTPLYVTFVLYFKTVTKMKINTSGFTTFQQIFHQSPSRIPNIYSISRTMFPRP